MAYYMERTEETGKGNPENTILRITRWESDN